MKPSLICEETYTARREKKRVQWKDSCRVRPFPMVPLDQQEDIWYQEDDYRNFKKERKTAVKLAQSVGIEAIEKTDFVSCLGVEFMIDQDRFEKKTMLQQNSRMAVFRAQLELAREAEENDEEPDLVSEGIISYAYLSFTRKAHMEAAKRASELRAIVFEPINATGLINEKSSKNHEVEKTSNKKKAKSSPQRRGSPLQEIVPSIPAIATNPSLPFGAQRFRKSIKSSGHKSDYKNNLFPIAV